MIESIKSYKERKLIYKIMFDFYENNYEEIPSIFKLPIIESLRNIVRFHCNNNDLSIDVINNIRKFLFQARECQDEYRTQRINIINEIIGIMNVQEKDDSLIFYRMQLYKRRNIKYLFAISNKEIRNEIENIHKSICNDFFVLTSHTDDVDDMTFITEYLPCLKNYELYYESLNTILKENPIVFRDQTFYNRMMCVLEYNNLINEELVDYSKKLVKKINRKIKERVD